MAAAGTRPAAAVELLAAAFNTVYRPGLDEAEWCRRAFELAYLEISQVTAGDAASEILIRRRAAALRIRRRRGPGKPPGDPRMELADQTVQQWLEQLIAQAEGGR